MAGALFQGPHLVLTVWLLAICLINQAKSGLSALALKRQWGISYPTAWLIQHQLMQSMAERDTQYRLSGPVQVKDAYLSGEWTGCKAAGRGSENKVPFVTTVSLNNEGHPQCVKRVPVPGLTRQAIGDWAKVDLSPGSRVISDGLACFSGVTDAGCRHPPLMVGTRKPRDFLEFSGINAIAGNLKTRFGGADHAFNCAIYGSRYLASFSCRFHRRFHLETLSQHLFTAATVIGLRPDCWLRQAEISC